MKVRPVFIVILIAAALLVCGGYLYLPLWNQKLDLQAKVIQLESSLKVAETRLARAKNQNNDLNAKLETGQSERDTLSKQVDHLTGTVGTLQKLTQTDPELLQKYSKVYFLNENYVPSALVNIDPAYLFNKDKPLQLHVNVWPKLLSLLRVAAANNGLTLQIDSAYRSFGEQATLKASYKFSYGAGTANQFSAEQGYSEHQLGTTVDFTTQAIGGALAGFDKTTAYQWLTDNAYHYGFILSYPKGNGYYEFEPWHWRFVGVALATHLHDQSKNFYDLDQREIDKYLVNIFD